MPLRVAQFLHGDLQLLVGFVQFPGARSDLLFQVPVGGFDLGHHAFDFFGHFIELAAEKGKLIVGMDLDAVGKISRS